MVKTAFVLALMLAVFATPAVSEIQLVFGTYAADKPSKTVRKFKPFLTYLADAMSERLGEQVRISMQISQDYEKGINALVLGNVDFARFGPASYITAKEQEPRIQILVMESKNGAKTFQGVIVVPKDSSIQSLAELRNGSFAFGSKLSTIGRYLAQQELVKAGIHADDLRTFSYLGRHDRVGRAVGKGDFDAGALKSNTFKALLKNNIPIRKLLSFDNVTKPWLVRADLDPGIIATMREIMLETRDAAILKPISKSGFLTGSDSDYIPIRDAMIKSREFGG
jgi:phosphonate transport system substrate-binding protein